MGLSLLAGFLVILLSGFASAPTQIKGSYLETDIEAYYSLNRTSGDVEDVTGNGYNGTAGGGVTRGATGIIQNAFDFDGVDDEIALDDSYFNWGQSDFTVAAWIYIKGSSTGDLTIYDDFEDGGARGNRMMYRPGSGLFVATYKGNLHGSALTTFADELASNKWWFVGFTRNNTGIYAWVNGSINASALGEARNATNYGEIPHIGHDADDAWGFNGTIDELPFYFRDLNSTEMQDLYNSGNALPWETAPADTCTYSGPGNWEVNCSDYCNITSNVVGDGSDFLLSGTGYFHINGANVSNFSLYRISGSCEARCTDGCFRY